MVWNASFNAKMKIQKYLIIMQFVSRTRLLVIIGNGSFSNWMVRLRIPCHSMKVSQFCRNWQFEITWFSVTCQDKQLFDDFLAGLLSENSVENSLDCPPVEQNFGILGNPLISCPSPTECNFFCLNGLLIGASSVTCSNSQSGSWMGDNGETFVACIKLFWNKIMVFYDFWNFIINLQILNGPFWLV